jgi:type I restriction enzyme M protein
MHGIQRQHWALARMNMFLHGADSARIEWCDTLNSRRSGERPLMKFDIVVANRLFLDQGEPTRPDDVHRFCGDTAK